MRNKLKCLLQIITLYIILLLLPHNVDSEVLNRQTDINRETQQTTITTEITTEHTTEYTTNITTTSKHTEQTISDSALNVNITHSDDELMLLAKVIDCEAGDDCSDEHKMYVGQVVLNRVKDDRFPNTISNVVYQAGQYHCVMTGKINKTPSTRSIQCAKALLSGTKACEENIVWQAEFPQGEEIVKIFETPYSTSYFCR